MLDNRKTRIYASLYFLGNIVENGKRKIFFVGLLILLIGMNLYKLRYASGFAANWDTVDFSLALDEFNLLEMQPHFPGYPYFILGGMIVHFYIENPSLALSVFNGLMFMLSAIPLYLIARRTFSEINSLLCVIFIHSFSYVLLLTAQPMSEAAALAVIWWYIWGIFVAYERKSLLFKMIPLFFYSILLGTRLSYIMFGIGIIWLWWDELKSYQGKERINRISLQIIAAISFQLIWVMALIISEGSVENFLNIAVGFTNGHFSDWGGGVTAEETPILKRIGILIFYNILWTGLFAQSYVSAAVYIAFFLYLLLKLKERSLHVSYSFVLTLMLGSYFLWALFAQNIDKPRHIAPIIIIGGYLLFHVLIGKQQSKLGYIMLTMLIAVNISVGFKLVKIQNGEVPATYQLARYLEEIDGDFIVYTWEETRVMEYLQVSYDHKRVQTYDYFLQDISYYNNDTIYLTSFVLSGFEKQGIDLSNQVEEVATFRSSELVDPVYFEIRLYKWKNNDLE